MSRAFIRLGSKGVVYVELVIVLLFLVPLLLLTVDISYALYEYQTLVKQARAGARYLSIQPPGDITYPSQTLSQYGKAECIVRTSVLDCRYPVLLPQLEKGGKVIVTINDSSNTPSLKNQSTQTVSVGTSDLSTRVNLVEVRIEGFRHELFKGLTTIDFGPIVSVMRQMN